MIVYGWGARLGTGTVQEWLVSEKLCIVGIPDDLDDVLALCAGLNVEPMLVPDPADSPAPSGLEALVLSAWGVGPGAVRHRNDSVAGLWAGSCEQSRFVQDVAAELDLPHLPYLNERQHAALPIEGAVLFDFSDLDHPRAPELSRLPIPAWVRAACARGDSSCMRLEHPNDLSLASAKLQKRNLGGPIRIQPALEGAVYRALAFKTGGGLSLCCLIAEEMTTSVYRVPLSMMVPAEGRTDLLCEVAAMAEQVNGHLPQGWGYVELEFVDAAIGLRLIDVQCPARLDPHLRQLVRLALGIDLLLASMACALGRMPSLAPTRHAGAAMTWLLARSGVVTGLRGVEEARRIDGVIEVTINAREGDILSHVVDIPSRERGGYIVATGDSATQARERLDAARARVWINTSPALL